MWMTIATRCGQMEEWMVSMMEEMVRCRWKDLRALERMRETLEERPAIDEVGLASAIPIRRRAASCYMNFTRATADTAMPKGLVRTNSGSLSIQHSIPFIRILHLHLRSIPTKYIRTNKYTPFSSIPPPSPPFLPMPLAHHSPRPSPHALLPTTTAQKPRQHPPTPHQHPAPPSPPRSPPSV